MKYGYSLHKVQNNLKDGTIWEVIKNINGTVQAIGLALLVLFFLVGIIKTCSSFAEVKKPEQVLKLFIRFVLAKTVITYGLELMLGIFKITQGIVKTIMSTAGFGNAIQTALPNEMITAIENCRILREYSTMGGNNNTAEC